MRDPKEIAGPLYAIRKDKARVARLLFEVGEKIKQLENEKTHAGRDVRLSWQTHLQSQPIDERLQAANQTRQVLQRDYDQILDSESALVTSFVPLSDPTQSISQWKSEYPILLMPLRIETRFRLDLGQLWVRVFPDDCSIDSFEPTLSETELRNVQAFWNRMWAAGGSEAEERAAWRGLVSSHGAGRARWLMNNYEPLNKDEKPGNKNAGDVILIIPTDQKPATEELVQALSNYWTAIWVADGKAADDQKAREILLASLADQQITDRAAVDLINAYAPFNLNVKPPAGMTRAEVNLSVIIIEFRKADQQPTKRNSWSQPARLNIFPDRLVLLGFNADGEQILTKVGALIPSPLFVTPDPLGAPDLQLKNEKGNLSAGDQLRWMVDFQRAVDWGLGFRITNDDLAGNSLLKDGFHRLVVLGVRLSADEQGGKELLESLLQSHQNSSKGFSIVPQGTPTNNTETAGAGFSRSVDADETFDTYVKQRDLVSSQNADGQFLATYLGIEPKVCLQALYGTGTDQAEARLMNFALFPGTLGYTLHTMLNPILSTETGRQIRKYFNNYVIGRGYLPAIRIGDQPYGILPTSVFSRIQWFEAEASPGVVERISDEKTRAFLDGLYQRLRIAHAWWQNSATREVDYIGKKGDFQQILLNLLELNASSVEFHSRHAQHVDHLYNILNMQGLGDSFQEALKTLLPDVGVADPESTMERIRALGYTGDEVPDLMKLVFWAHPQRLKGPLIDDRPLSERDKIRSYTTDNRNYLQWLADSARQSLETLRTQSGFKEDKPPLALLYILTRYALMNAFWESGVNLQLDAQMLSDERAEGLRREPVFVHITREDSGSESRWGQLYTDLPGIPAEGKPFTVEQYISQVLTQDQIPPSTHKIEIPDWATSLVEQVRAIDTLANIPTARLERLLAEHLDCCSYRLDAWELGLVNCWLGEVRRRHYNAASEEQGGVYLGAFGWLETVIPEDKTLREISLSDELATIFDPKGPDGKRLDPPLLKDDTNGGYIHAPSLNQAVTAAILRNGYLSNATKNTPGLFAINLSSERVRLAMAFIEGIRNGQSLGALLGYQLERDLHDRYQLENNPNDKFTLDEFIFKLRKEFPLRALHLKSTSESEGDGPKVAAAAIESLEARNVVDGLSLVEHVIKQNNKSYPFGKSLPLDVSEKQKVAINAEVERLLDIHDALADLALAESVHQVAQGNYDRASATLDAYGKSSFPPIPDVIQTPRTGANLTHRVGLHFEAGLDKDSNPVAADITTKTARGIGEPALNQWLAELLPAPANVGCQLIVKDLVTGVPKGQFISWKDLQLQPIDLLYLVRPENQQAMTELDDRLMRHFWNNTPPRPDSQVEIHYTEPVAGKITFFQLAPLIQSLRTLVLNSRALQAGDVMLRDGTEANLNESVFADASRIELLIQTLKVLNNDLQTFTAKLDVFSTTVHGLQEEQNSLAAEKNLEGTSPHRIDEIDARLQELHEELKTQLSNVDDYLAQMVGLAEQASRFALPQTGWGFAYAWKAEQFALILEQVNSLVRRWNQRLDDFDGLVEEYEHLPTTSLEERSRLLQRAELLVSTQVVKPLITLVDLQKKRERFSSKQNDFRGILSTSETSLSKLLAHIEGYLTKFDELDVVRAEIDEIRKTDQEIIRFVAELAQIVQRIIAQIDRRVQEAEKKIAEHDAAARQSVRVKAVQEAAGVLLGDDFRLLPEFELPTDNHVEWTRCLDASNVLLDHLRASGKSMFPVDDWLYGIARVREKLHHWERLTILAGAVGQIEPELIPIQLPHQDNNAWLALEFPQDLPAVPPGDHLLYTAHYASGFDKTKRRQCGLLLDEWTEKIPGSEETTGIAFHFNRPNAEPPQALLLVVSPSATGQWSWQDLVDALQETIDLAKLRAVEPAHIEKESLNRLLPASLLAFTLREISISSNLSENNNLMDQLT